MSEKRQLTSSSFDVIRELAASARSQSRTLAKQAEDASRVDNAWEDLSRYVERGWPFHVLHLMQKEAELFKRTSTENDKYRVVLAEISSAAKEQADVARRRFPAYFEEVSRTKRLPLDRESRHPRYTFDQGFFRVEVDDFQGMARLSDYEGQLAEIPADVDAIFELTEREHRRVFGRPFSCDKFLRKLRHQYLAVVKRDQLRDGDSVPIRHITRRLGKNEKAFRTDEFLVDLSRLIEQCVTEIDGRHLDLQQTKDTANGMLLHGPAGQGYVGFIVFRR